MPTENIDLITKAVSSHRKVEDRKSLQNCAVARYATLYNSKAINFWMVLKPNNAGVQVPRESLGRTHLHVSGPTTYTPTGDKVFSRDSKMGGHMIMAKDWQTIYTQPDGKEVLLEIISRCQYQPIPGSGDARNVEISLPEHDHPYLISSLIAYLKEQRQDTEEAERDRIELERKLAKEAKQKEELEATLRTYEVERAAKRAKKDRNRRLIKEQASLRMKPVLDAQQERIKRSGLYDNTTVIIDGGPGTGKTTSLIQRIKYFTDPEVIEENLSGLNADVKREILDRNNPSWLFLSPSTLLKAYLKESMSQEGLVSNNNTVQVWDDHRSVLIKAYGLINPERSNAFKAYRKSHDKAFFLRDGKGIKEYTLLFERHLIQSIQKLFKPAESFKRVDFLYKLEVVEIQRILAEKRPKSLMGIVTLLEALKVGPGQRLADDGKEFNETLQEVSLRVQMLSTQEEDRKERLYDLIRESLASQVTESEEEEEEDLEGEKNEEDIQEDELHSEAAIAKQLNNRIKRVIRKLASQSIGERAKFTPHQENIRSLLIGIDEIEPTDLKYLGEVLLFRKVFGRILRGTGSLLLTRLPAYYRSFRKSLHEQPIANVLSITILNAIIEKENNSRLHPDEQSFLIGFINNFLKQLFNKKKRVYSRLSHAYKEAYEENAKRVIAVDEASDFTLADVYAIESLLRPSYASLTLCGDIMQRMTSKGIREWEDVSVVLDNVEENSLEVSYRQSPTLLRIAKDIYERTTGTVSQYRPAMQPVDNEPKGLLLTSEDEEDKVEWIAKRIMEICKSMDGMVPSIAIFLPTGNNINAFAASLKDTDVLADNDIRVMACLDGQALGDERTVRVFDIEHIKGLEFEAAFFHNIDRTLGSNYTSDMLLRNLYVGLSRATFYSAVTTERELPEELSFLGDHFEEGGTW
jgi:hypothetical protein